MPNEQPCQKANSTNVWGKGNEEDTITAKVNSAATLSEYS